MKKIYVTRTEKFTASPSELDFINREQFGWEDYDKQEFVEIMVGNPSTSDEPISIDNLIEILQEAKAAGSTHVAIDYHSDHIGYDISGVELRLSTDEEIEKCEAKRKAEQDKRRQIHDLQSQIMKLQKWE